MPLSQGIADFIRLSNSRRLSQLLTAPTTCKLPIKTPATDCSTFSIIRKALLQDPMKAAHDMILVTNMAKCSFGVQNLGEAEYVVSLFQYMRLRGYPADKISILTTYNGQKALLRDVVERRCASHPAFGRPRTVCARVRVRVFCRVTAISMLIVWISDLLLINHL